MGRRSRPGAGRPKARLAGATDSFIARYSSKAAAEKDPAGIAFLPFARPWTIRSALGLLVVFSRPTPGGDVLLERCHLFRRDTRMDCASPTRFGPALTIDTLNVPFVSFKAIKRVLLRVYPARLPPSTNVPYSCTTKMNTASRFMRPAGAILNRMSPVR